MIFIWRSFGWTGLFFCFAIMHWIGYPFEIQAVLGNSPPHSCFIRRYMDISERKNAQNHKLNLSITYALTCMLIVGFGIRCTTLNGERIVCSLKLHKYQIARHNTTTTPTNELLIRNIGVCTTFYLIKIVCKQLQLIYQVTQCYRFIMYSVHLSHNKTECVLSHVRKMLSGHRMACGTAHAYRANRSNA